MRLRDYIIEANLSLKKPRYFSPGWVNGDDLAAIPEGSIADGLNWVVKKDKVELRRGMKMLGADADVGQVTGLRVARKIDGTDMLWRTRVRKIEYYISSTNTFTEVGTNSLPAGASGEEISIEPYTSLSGYAIYFSSPLSGIYKIMLANPETLIDMVSTSHRGRIRIKNNAMFLWDRKGTDGARDKTGFYRSKLDRDVYSDYTAITDENIGTGNGVLKTFSDTLAFKAAGAKRSCFGISVTDGTETFNDNGDGTLTGNLGGTGTINYATGVISVTFNTAPNNLQAITASGYFEDPTSNGICDFAFSATRVAGEGFVLRQDDGGGDMKNLGEYNQTYYCFHEKKTWAVVLGANDADAANPVYRNKVGIPNWRALAESGEGVYYVDESDDNDVRIRLLTLANFSTEVIPKSVSNNIDLTDFRFSKAVVKEWGDYILIACRRSTATQNDRMLVYNRRLGIWNPPADYYASCLEVLSGALVGGDSVTNNVFELFSGVDDDDSKIQNYIEFNETQLTAAGMKKPRRFVIAGDIQADQVLKIKVSLDHGAFIEIGEIDGSGSYVDTGTRVTVGPNTIGKKEVGGGGGGIEAHPYQREINISSLVDKCEAIQVRFEATEIGYVSVQMFGFKDIRWKGRKIPKRYRP